MSKYLDTKKVPTRLVGPVERHLLTRPRDTSRRTDILHPSELCKTDFCARSAYFVMTGAGVPEPPPGLRLQSIFDEGHAIHHKWQNWIREMGALYGRWKCAECETVTGYCLPPSKCGVCGSGNMRYAEVTLIDDLLMIVGHADGWVKGHGDDFLIEIKSVGTGTIRMEQPSLLKDTDLAGAWKSIRRPFPTHLRQGILYLELVNRMCESGLLDSAPSEIVFLYELKMDQSYKEFVVKRDTEMAKPMLDMAYDVARSVKAKKAPSCTNSTTGECSKCSPYSTAA